MRWARVCAQMTRLDSAVAHRAKTLTPPPPSAAGPPLQQAGDEWLLAHSASQATATLASMGSARA